jgi:hypothetical protein
MVEMRVADNQVFVGGYVEEQAKKGVVVTLEVHTQSHFVNHVIELDPPMGYQSEPIRLKCDGNPVLLLNHISALWSEQGLVA